MNEDELIPKAEHNLVDELKEKCDDRGYEKNPEETAEILHKLGLLYMKRKDDKVCLIQSAALLAAAIVRKPNDNEAIKADFQGLWNVVLQEAKVKNISPELNYTSTAIEAEVNAMREHVNKRIRNIARISQNSETDTLHHMEEQKILDIENLLVNIANQYVSVMNNVSDYCLSVLGNPPSNTRFALVGMGSIARKEVTPFSDFENIIVLEEGVQHKAIYENILEYFRWFAVTFQIVLISLGETILPSVAIPSLNDFCSSERNWFYDNFTPSGISFDGLMPHACKTPLGRQKPTADKHWPTELIKPVSEMLKYLDSETDLKNGYHLADILTKTCFVSGDRAVYDDFEVNVKKALFLQRKHDSKFFQLLSEQVEEDMGVFHMLNNLQRLFGKEHFNLKRVIYRSATVFISACGKYYGLKGSSCFDIIREMQTKGLISEGFAHKLNYAVAIACEVRLKTYAQRHKQHDFVNSVSGYTSAAMGIVKAIGEKSALDFFAITWSLQQSLPPFTADGIDVKIEEANSDFPIFYLVTCFLLGAYERCIDLSYKHLQSGVSSMDNVQKVFYLTLVGLCHFYTKCMFSASRDFKNYLKDVAGMESQSQKQANENFVTIIDDCLKEVFREAVWDNNEDEINDLLYLFREILDGMFDHNSAMDTSIKITKDDFALSSIYLKEGSDLSTYIAFSHVGLQRIMENYLDELVEHPLFHPLNMAKLVYVLRNFKDQLLQRERDDTISYQTYFIPSCIPSASLSLTISSSSSSSLSSLLYEDEKHEAGANCMKKLGKDLFKICRYEEALCYFQLEMKLRSYMAVTNSDVIKCKMKIGKCFYKLSFYEKALAQFESLISLKLHKKAGKRFMFYFGRCLFKLKRYKECAHFLSLAANIKFQTAIHSKLHVKIVTSEKFTANKMVLSSKSGVAGDNTQSRWYSLHFKTHISLSRNDIVQHLMKSNYPLNRIQGIAEMKGKIFDITCKDWKDVAGLREVLETWEKMHEVRRDEVDLEQVLIGWVPVAMPNESIRCVLESNYCKVEKITSQICKDGLLSGIRIASIKKEVLQKNPIPMYIYVDGLQLYVSYVEQEFTCEYCSEKGHKQAVTK